MCLENTLHSGRPGPEELVPSRYAPRGRLRPDLPVHLAAAEAEFWASPDFSRASMPSPATSFVG
jgi:hypothetical protein